MDRTQQIVASEAGKLVCRGAVGENKFELDYIKTLVEDLLEFEEVDWNKAIEALNFTKQGVEIHSDGYLRLFYE